MKKITTKVLSVFKVILISLITVIYSLLSLITVFLKKDAWYFALASSWSGILLFFSGIRVTVVGKEKLEKNKSYIFISNHSSHFDIPVLLGSLSDMVSLVYKQELEKIPIFGYALARSPHISIDRSHPKKAIESINNAVAHLETGASVLIFPEGTRSKDGNMGSFKRGAFMVASRSGKPIVPVSVTGTFRLLPNEGFNILGGKVKVEIHDIIDNYEVSGSDDEKALMTKVKDIIEKPLKK